MYILCLAEINYGLPRMVQIETNLYLTLHWCFLLLRNAEMQCVFQVAYMLLTILRKLPGNTRFIHSGL